MALSEKDFEDTRLARPVSVIDLWDIDDRINRLEGCLERLEKCIEVLVLLHKEERVKNWELILKQMLKEECEVKKNTPIFEVDDNNPKSIFEEEEIPESDDDIFQ